MVGRDSIEVIQSNRYDRALAYMSEDAKTELLEAMRQGTNGREWRGSLEEVKVAFDKVFPGHDFYDLRTLVGYGANGGFRRDNYYNSSYQASRGQYANNSEHKTYEYLMAYSFPYFGGTPMYHTGDLAFWFYSLGNVRYQIAGDEETAYRVADFAATALANFCKYGDPSTDEVKWLPHEWYENEDGQLVNNLHCMIVDRDSYCADGDYGDELNYLMTMVRSVDPNAANKFPDGVNLANVRVIWYGMTMNVRDGDIDYENRLWTGELPNGAYLVELVTDAEGNTTQQRITLVSANAPATTGLDEEPAPEEEVTAPVEDEVAAPGEEEATAPEEEATIPVNEPETPVEAEEPVPETEPVPEA